MIKWILAVADQPHHLKNSTELTQLYGCGYLDSLQQANRYKDGGENERRNSHLRHLCTEYGTYPKLPHDK
ncbi:hypothetical protein PILCRDRAFT_496995 [Piloderma croceum F 1598]|uniref:Uncharacterized protein n=1 Tax=Piloderma croceum (strain F 1598) TaxID=765440 RepID=A0A0C3B5U1_PILCF|nr:hypothetical protein PILCRDRAFT_496995 [Piloderma croceum F 1598]